jgi:hypothetical protein
MDGSQCFHLGPLGQCGCCMTILPDDGYSFFFMSMVVRHDGNLSSVPDKLYPQQAACLWLIEANQAFSNLAIYGTRRFWIVKMSLSIWSMVSVTTEHEHIGIKYLIGVETNIKSLMVTTMVCISILKGFKPAANSEGSLNPEA